jgi:lysophospholipase L1-like esterase
MKYRNQLIYDNSNIRRRIDYADTILLFGDSQTDNQGGPGYTGGIGTNADAKLDKGWIWYAIGQYLKGGPRVIQNMGIGGSTVLVHDGSANPMINRYKPATDYNPSIITFLGGINDLQNFSDADSNPERVMDGIVTMVDYFLQSGAEIIMQTSWLKYFSSSTASQRAVNAKVAMLAQFQREYAMSRPGILLVDSYKLLANPAATELNALSTVFNDGLHQGNLGARTIANDMGPKMLARWPEKKVDRRPYQGGDYMQSTRKVTPVSMSRVNGVVTIATTGTNVDLVVGQPIFVWQPNDHTFTGWWTVSARNSAVSFSYVDTQADATPSVTSSFVSDINQLLPNPLFLTTTGGTVGTGCTGTAPANTNHNCINATAGHVSAVIDSFARAVNREGDACGNNCRATITAGVSTANAEWYRMGFTVAAYSVSRSKGGDKLRFNLGINLTGMSNVIGVRAYAQWSEDGGATKTTYCLYDDQATNLPYSQSDVIDLVLETNEFEIGPTSGAGPVIQMFVQVSFGAGAGACVLEVGRTGLYALSDAHDFDI